jgi:hypothetical protein
VSVGQEGSEHQARVDPHYVRTWFRAACASRWAVEVTLGCANGFEKEKRPLDASDTFVAAWPPELPAISGSFLSAPSGCVFAGVEGSLALGRSEVARPFPWPQAWQVFSTLVQFFKRRRTRQFRRRLDSPAPFGVGAAIPSPGRLPVSISVDIPLCRQC